MKNEKYREDSIRRYEKKKEKDGLVGCLSIVIVLLVIIYVLL